MVVSSQARSQRRIHLHHAVPEVERRIRVHRHTPIRCNPSHDTDQPESRRVAGIRHTVRVRAVVLTPSLRLIKGSLVR
jgi:hypothetical protein